jgi:hypothetical protein
MWPTGIEVRISTSAGLRMHFAEHALAESRHAASLKMTKPSLDMAHFPRDVVQMR